MTDDKFLIPEGFTPQTVAEFLVEEPIKPRERVIPMGEPAPSIACLLTEDTDTEAFAALPECPHCDGTGKDLTGTPWEDTR